MSIHSPSARCARKQSRTVNSKGSCRMGMPGVRRRAQVLGHRPDTNETKPMSRFLPHILAAFAELEREMIRERVRALAPVKAHGWI